MRPLLALLVTVALLPAGALHQVSRLLPPSQPGAEAEHRERTFTDPGWDTVFHVGSLTDTLLARPRIMASGENRVYVYDYLGHEVIAYSGRGRLSWTFGRKGGGPGEFRSPFDIEVGPDGDVWVYDPANARITVLSARGKSKAVVPVEKVSARDVLPLGNRVGLTRVGPGAPFVVMTDREGEEIGEIGYPVDYLSQVRAGLAQTLAAQRGSLWVVGFPWGKEFFRYRGSEMECGGELVEGRSLREASTREERTAWIVSIGLMGREIVTLARGETKDALGVVDRYSLEDCSYIGSWRLPGRFVAMSATEDVLYLASEDPYPHVVGLEPSALRLDGADATIPEAPTRNSEQGLPGSSSGGPRR